MPLEAFAIVLKLPVLALVAGRIAGVVMFLPLIGGVSVPMQVRALLVFGLAILIAPLAPPPPELPTRLWALALGVACELGLGALIGLAVRMVYAGLELAGLMIAQQSGLAFGQIVDPNSGEDSSLLSSFYVQLGGVVFLILGGHRVLIATALDTFQTIPLLGGADVLSDGLTLLTDALVLGAAIAVRIAAPVVLTLFLVIVALGFVGRTVPQLNIISVGFPIKGLVAMVLIAVTLPPAMEAFTGALDEVVGWIGVMVSSE